MRNLFLFLVLVSSGAYIEYTAEIDTRSNIKNSTSEMTPNEKISFAGNSHIQRAVELSYRAIEHEDGGPFGSVVVRDGNVIGEGWNQTRRLNDPSAHAEVMAIRDAYSKGVTDLKGCVVYASAQPCPMCLSLIYLTGAEKVFYLIPGEEIAKIGSRLSVGHVYDALREPAGKRPIAESRVAPEEVKNVLEQYKRYKW